MSERIFRAQEFDFNKVPFDKKTVTYTAGYWDLLHLYHLMFIEQCALIGDPVAVGVIPSEKSKKPGRPIMTDDERMGALSYARVADFICLEKPEYEEVLDILRPKNVVFSAEPVTNTDSDRVKQAQIAMVSRVSPGSTIHFIPRQSNSLSTTKIVERVLDGPPNIPEGEVIMDADIHQRLMELSTLSEMPFKTASLITTKENLIISSGVNYTPKILVGTITFTNKNSVEYNQQKPRPMHAEMDAIIKAIQTVGIKNCGELVVHALHMPCAGCAEFIARCGFEKVVYYHEFDNDYGLSVLRKNGVEITQGKL